MFNFGSGSLYGLVSVGGVLVPRKFGTLQNVSLDMSFEQKELYGQKQFPVDIARGKGKISGKAAFASLNGGLLNDIIYGQSLATGQTVAALGEAGSIPAATTYTVTVANAADFVDDLGVVYAATGLAFVRVASAPAVGQYTVAAGVYTFAAADASKNVLIDYSYTVAASGSTITLTNQLLGTTPSFQLVLPLKYGGKQLFMKFYKAFSSKISMATKQDDYTIPDFDFMIAADSATDQIGIISLSDA